MRQFVHYARITKTQCAGSFCEVVPFMLLYSLDITILWFVTVYMVAVIGISSLCMMIAKDSTQKRTYQIMFRLRNRRLVKLKE